MKLTKELKRRITDIHETFAEFYPFQRPLENVFGEFASDLRYASEIAIWEMMAAWYKDAVVSCRSARDREALFGRVVDVAVKMDAILRAAQN